MPILMLDFPMQWEDMMRLLKCLERIWDSLLKMASSTWLEAAAVQVLTLSEQWRKQSLAFLEGMFHKTNTLLCFLDWRNSCSQTLSSLLMLESAATYLEVFSSKSWFKKGTMNRLSKWLKIKLKMEHKYLTLILTKDSSMGNKQWPSSCVYCKATPILQMYQWW